MKIVFMGCVQFSKLTLEHLLKLPNIQISGIITKQESKINADFTDLSSIAKRNNIPYLYVEKNHQKQVIDWLKQVNFDVIYCFGWSYLLKREILSLPKLGVIGYHPAALPKNRGRHPIIWALALGLQETASTFFFMDEGADSGDILSQKFINIDNSDDAATVYQKLFLVAKEQITEFTQQLLNHNFPRIPQNHNEANYWRKRGKKDGEIDWRMSARTIHNLVRALTKPYVGSHCLLRGKEIKIWKTEVINIEPEPINLEPGKVIDVQGSEIIVKCGEGCVKLIEHEFNLLPEKGIYL